MVDTATEVIPDGLDAMEPGPVLAAFLASIDVSKVSGFDLIVVLRAHRRMASHYEAQAYRDMAAVTDAMVVEYEEPWESAAESAAAEIRSALHLTRRGADVELVFALDLRDRFPRLASMLESGDIDVRRARTIERNTVHLSDEAARSVVDRIADVASVLTTGELAARIRRLCIESAPTEAENRYRHAVDGRRVVMEPSEDGTAHLSGLDLPPQRVAAVTRRINGLARGLRGSGETRTMDQLRADVYLDLLAGRDRQTTGNDNGGGGVVDIRVDLDTLAGLADHPGELAGYGPVISDIARQVADDQQRCEWRYTVVDTQTGQAIQTGTTRRRPDASQRRTIESRDVRCVFPGCRMPSAECDLDHCIPWSQGGPTTVRHLAPLCRHDHITVKHGAGWTYRRLPNGDYLWTSRLGHTYTTTRAPP